MTESTTLNALERVFNVYDDLESYAISLAPENALLFKLNGPIPSSVFFNQFWFCDEQFVRLNPYHNCSLVFIPDKKAVQEEEFNRHAIFLSSYFAWRNQKEAPIPLESYIKQYNSPEYSLSCGKKFDDIKDRISAIQSALASPHFCVPHYQNKELKSEITKLFNQISNKGYYYKGDSIYTEGALSMLLGCLLNDGGRTDQKVFYCLCETEEQVANAVYLHCAIKNLLHLPAAINLVPQITFPLIVFCHIQPISTGSRLAERLPTCEEYLLFDGPYYKSDHFKKNLDIRIKRIKTFARSAESRHKKEKLQTLLDQLQWIKLHFVDTDITGRDIPSFHKLINQVETNWDSLRS